MYVFLPYYPTKKKRHRPCHELEHSSFPQPKKRRWPWSQVGDFEGLRVRLGAKEGEIRGGFSRPPQSQIEKWDTTGK